MQSLPDWISARTRAFTLFGGTPNIVVGDNLKSGVTVSQLYEPDLNPTFQDMATHYGISVVPTGVRIPRICPSGIDTWPSSHQNGRNAAPRR